MVTRDNPRERAPGQAVHQLREQHLSGVHGRALPGKGSGKPPPTSNRHHPKSPKNPYAPDISMRFVRKTPDSSDANYQLIHDNLLDLTHLSYVHENTLG